MATFAPLRGRTIWPEVSSISRSALSVCVPTLIVQTELKLDSHSGVTNVFRSKRGDRLKILVWDGTGLVMIYKVLEQGSFAWPKVHDGVMRLSRAQFEALCEGVWGYPHGDADESFPEEVRVLDPRHPGEGSKFLVGRSFAGSVVCPATRSCIATGSR